MYKKCYILTCFQIYLIIEYMINLGPAPGPSTADPCCLRPGYDGGRHGRVVPPLLPAPSASAPILKSSRCSPCMYYFLIFLTQIYMIKFCLGGPTSSTLWQAASTPPPPPACFFTRQPSNRPLRQPTT